MSVAGRGAVGAGRGAVGVVGMAARTVTKPSRGSPSLPDPRARLSIARDAGAGGQLSARWPAGSPRAVEKGGAAARGVGRGGSSVTCLPQTGGRRSVGAARPCASRVPAAPTPRGSVRAARGRRRSRGPAPRPRAALVTATQPPPRATLLPRRPRACRQQTPPRAGRAAPLLAHPGLPRGGRKRPSGSPQSRAGAPRRHRSAGRATPASRARGAGQGKRGGRAASWARSGAQGTPAPR